MESSDYIQRIPEGTFLQYLKYREYLKMGGNVIIDGVEAERINLNQLKRATVVSVIDETLDKINKEAKNVTGIPIWSDALFISKKFLSGSAYHFFMTGTIADDEFISVKSSIGDIDAQVNVNQSELIKDFLDKTKGKKIGDAKLIGYKTSPGQFITLWEFATLKTNIQIDLETVEFNNKGMPTDWSQFSHSSAWDDLKQGIKGYHHKMLLQAIEAPKFQMMLIKAKTTRGKDKILFRSTHSFSISHGIREKMVPVFDNAGKPVFEDGIPQFKELSTKESSGNRNLAEIYYHFFGRVPSSTDLKKMHSFTGIVDLLKIFFKQPEQVKIADEYIQRIWGKGAQGLYRENPQMDLAEKTSGARYITKELGLDLKKYNTVISTYYKNYR